MALNPFYNRPLFPAGVEEFFTPSPFFFRHPAFDLPIVPSLMKEGGPLSDDLIRSSPGYTITEADGKFNINVDLPGMKPSDIKVELEHDGSVLHISGERKIKTENTYKEVSFDRRFSLGANVDVEKMTANLADGVLTLTAPKMEPEKPKTRTIAITEGPATKEAKK